VSRTLSLRISTISSVTFYLLLVYCRSINLNEEVLLYDEDLLLLKGKTVTQYFIEIMESLCESCKKFTEEKDFKQLECNCKICKTCLMSKVKIITEDKVCFNTFEERKFSFKIENEKLKTVHCFCYTEFNYIDAIRKFNEDELKEFLDQANVRLAEQVQDHCLGCEINLPKEATNLHDPNSGQDVPTSKPKGFTVKILENNGKVNTNHIICSKCYKKVKSQMEEDTKPDQIHCNLCDADHSIDPRVWENKLNEKKCICDCIIF
jgi:hypothetical protein